jgi:hypothetical protein
MKVTSKRHETATNETICIREKNESISEKQIVLRDADECFFRFLRELDSFATKKIKIVAFRGLAFRLLGYNIPSRDTDLIFPNARSYKYFMYLARVAGYSQEEHYGSLIKSSIDNTNSNQECHYGITPGYKMIRLLEPYKGKDGNIIFHLGTKYVTLEILNLYDSVIGLTFAGKEEGRECALYLMETRNDINLKRLVARYRKTFKFPRNQNYIYRAMESLDAFLEEGLRRRIKGFYKPACTGWGLLSLVWR